MLLRDGLTLFPFENDSRAARSKGSEVAIGDYVTDFAVDNVNAAGDYDRTAKHYPLVRNFVPNQITRDSGPN